MEETKNNEVSEEVKDFEERAKKVTEEIKALTEKYQIELCANLEISPDFSSLNAVLKYRNTKKNA